MFVVDQIDPATGQFDEHKVMLGFGSLDEATQAYSDSFSDGSGPDRAGAITQMSVSQFKTWLKNLDTKKPLAWEPARSKTPPISEGGFGPTAPTKETTSDRETGLEVRSEVGVGQEPVQAPEQQEGRPEAAGAGGILQAPEGQEVEAPAAGVDIDDLPLSEDERKKKVAANDRAAFRGALEVTGKAQWEGSRYEILALPNGESFYYRRSSGNASIEKGPGYPARWTRDEAIEAATLDAFGPQPAQPEPPADDAPEWFTNLTAPEAPADELAALKEARDTRESAAGDWLVAQGFAKRASDGKLTILPKGRRRIKELEAEKPAGDSFEAVRTIASGFAEAFREGRRFKTIVEARKFAEELAGEKLPPKTIEEAIEAGIVMRARQITAERKSPVETYDALVELYGQQPLLAQRTSTSVENQAYSTPAPLAYLASRLAGITAGTAVYEPTAGNGMLLIDAAPRQVRANELNPDRAAALRWIMPGREDHQRRRHDGRPGRPL